MKISKEAKIGIATIVAIIMFIWGFNFLKGKNIFRATNVFYIVYDDLGGLKESGDVVINGFKVGQVTNISLEDFNSRKVIVKILVRKKYKLPSGTVAKLSSIDFMSTKAIELILSNNAGFQKSGDTLKSKMGEGIMDRVDDLEEKIMHIAFSVDTLLSSLISTFDEQTRYNLQKSISNLRTSTDTFNLLLTEGGDLRSAISDIKYLTALLKKSLKSLPETMDNLNSVSDSLQQSEIKLLINTTAETLEKLNIILGKTSEGEGTLGKLVNNDSLYVQLNNTTKELELLLEDLRNNPKRYVHFSVFGKNEKQ